MGCLALVVVWAVSSIFFGWIVSLLWNAVAVPLFGLPVIDAWMGIGILLLLSLLTKGFRISVKG